MIDSILTDLNIKAKVRITWKCNDRGSDEIHTFSHPTTFDLNALKDKVKTILESDQTFEITKKENQYKVHIYTPINKDTKLVQQRGMQYYIRATNVKHREDGPSYYDPKTGTTKWERNNEVMFELKPSTMYGFNLFIHADLAEYPHAYMEVLNWLDGKGVNYELA